MFYGYAGLAPRGSAKVGPGRLVLLTSAGVCEDQETPEDYVVSCKPLEDRSKAIAGMQDGQRTRCKACSFGRWSLQVQTRELRWLLPSVVFLFPDLFNATFLGIGLMWLISVSTKLLKYPLLIRKLDSFLMRCRTFTWLDTVDLTRRPSPNGRFLWTCGGWMLLGSKYWWVSVALVSRLVTISPSTSDTVTLRKFIRRPNVNVNLISLPMAFAWLTKILKACSPYRQMPKMSSRSLL